MKPKHGDGPPHVLFIHVFKEDITNSPHYSMTDDITQGFVLLAKIKTTKFDKKQFCHPVTRNKTSVFFRQHERNITNYGQQLYCLPWIPRYFSLYIILWQFQRNIRQWNTLNNLLKKERNAQGEIHYLKYEIFLFLAWHLLHN